MKTREVAIRYANSFDDVTLSPVRLFTPYGAVEIDENY